MHPQRVGCSFSVVLTDKKNKIIKLLKDLKNRNYLTFERYKMSESTSEKASKKNGTTIIIKNENVDDSFGFLTPNNIIPVVLIGGFVVNMLIKNTLGALLSPITAIIETTGQIAQQTIETTGEIIGGVTELAGTGLEQVTSLVTTAQLSTTEIITTATEGFVDIFTTTTEEFGDIITTFAVQPAAIVEAIGTLIPELPDISLEISPQLIIGGTGGFGDVGGLGGGGLGSIGGAIGGGFPDVIGGTSTPTTSGGGGGGGTTSPIGTLTQGGGRVVGGVIDVVTGGLSPIPFIEDIFTPLGGLF